MEELGKQQVASQFKQLAELHFEKGDLSSTCFCYISCLKVSPELKNELKSRFLLALTYLGQLLEKKKQFSEIFIIYEEALKVYDDCEEIYHNLGAHLLRLGYPDKAAFHFREALRINDNYLPGYRSLHSSYCALVERWHYRMLNDDLRNKSYRDAVAAAIRQGFDTVLDVGTGTGLFCLYALHSGAQRIYGCDHNPIMISIATRVLSSVDPNAEKVKLLEKHSNELVVPTDIPERVSLLVTETMDSCMLGEHMLQTLQYAWRNLLHSPYISGTPVDRPCSLVIPRRGFLFFTAIQSARLARKYLYPLTGVEAEDFANAFSSISLKDNTPENFQFLNLPNLHVELDEPYDTERLQTLSDCVYLIEPQHLYHINFNDPAEIDTFLRHDSKCFYQPTCTVDGYFHAIVTWFRVHLDDNIQLSNAPDYPNAKSCCWDQAVFPSHQAYRLVPGCAISVNANHAGGKVTFQADRITYPDGSTCSMQSESKKAPASFVIMLNDTSLLEHLRIAAVKFLNGFQGENELRVLDTFPVPIFGLTVLRNIHLINRSIEELRLVCVVECEDAVLRIQAMANHNGIPVDCVDFVSEDDLDRKRNQFTGKYFDAIILNVLDKEGDLSESTIGRIDLFKSLLKDDGVLLPEIVEVCSQLIHSDYIEENMRVVNGDITRFGIGEAINEYQVSQMVEMDLTSLTFEQHSTPFISHMFSMDQFDSEFSKEFFVTVCRPGPVNSIIYWFNVYFYESESSYSTLQTFSYVHQAAFLTKFPIVFQQNDNAVVQFVYHHGTFLINLKNWGDKILHGWTFIPKCEAEGLHSMNRYFSKDDEHESADKSDRTDLII